jgi:hypothetical protein
MQNSNFPYCFVWVWKLGRSYTLRTLADGVGSVFRRKREQVTVGWRKLHNEELNNLYSLQNITRVIKSRQ